MVQQLRHVAGQCDGVRCDMAMLLLPSVFQRTWGDLSLPRDGRPPVDEPFWPGAIASVHEEHPDFLFMAEVYWNLEWELQQQGFACTYDKRLYDRLHARDAGGARGHLGADLGFQGKSVRFLENHDEPRAAAAFSWPVHQAAAMVTFLVPGLRFFHEGQLQGRHVKASMHLGRRPEESVDSAIQAFYDRLLTCLKRTELRDGDWQLLECKPAWDGNPTWSSYVSFLWKGPNDQVLLGVVNLGATQGQCRIELPFEAGKKVGLFDLMGPSYYERDGRELATNGLFIDLSQWGYNLFQLNEIVKAQET
jgi:hypothetical protein